MKSALIIVDVQKDFAPGGTLPVPDAHAIVPVIDALAREPFDVIVASKDWHPEDHCSFAIQHNKEPAEEVVVEGLPQRLWPIHCVQKTEGAQFLSGWDASKVDHIIHKGTDGKVDSYSAFYDNARRHSTGLEEYLKKQKISRVFLAGLATDVCVRATALDALSLGFITHVVKDACRGLDKAEDALKEIQSAGGHLCESSEVGKILRTYP